MSDEIRLTGLTVTGYHGVFEHEKRDGQPFVVDCTLGVDTTAAAQSDDLTETVHYGELAEALAAVVAGEPYDLIETLAHRLLDVALGYELVQWADLSASLVILGHHLTLAASQEHLHRWGTSCLSLPVCLPVAPNLPFLSVTLTVPAHIPAPFSDITVCVCLHWLV